MPLRVEVLPEGIPSVLLTTSYQDIYQVPVGKTGATIRGLVISNADVVGGVPTAHRVWLHVVPDGGSPGLDNHLLYDQEFLNGIDGEGVLTLGALERLVAKVDADNVVAIRASGAETMEYTP